MSLRAEDVLVAIEKRFYITRVLYFRTFCRNEVRAADETILPEKNLCEASSSYRKFFSHTKIVAICNSV